MFLVNFNKRNTYGLIILTVILFLVSACGSDNSTKLSVGNGVTGVTKDLLIQYFTNDLGFQFGKEDTDPKGNQSKLGTLGKIDSPQFVNFQVIYHENTIKKTVMTVLLNGDNSVNNRNLIYISKLIEKVLPDIQNRDKLVKQGITEALQKNRFTINVNSKILDFSYVKDAGGVKGDNAIIFRYDTEAKPESEPSPSSQKIDVTFSVNPKIAAGSVQITGTTNLPNGTELLFTLSNGKNYSSQTKTKVSNGTFSTESFSQNGGPLEHGAYNVIISTPYTFVQEESIQKALGMRGEMLTGQYVHSEPSGNMVTYKMMLNVK